MKRALVVACVLMLAVCLLASAHAAAPKGGYVLLESMKNVPASTGEITLPEGLEKPVRVTSFSAEGTQLKLTLDRPAANLQINELDFSEGVEKVIFAQENVSGAEIETTGNEYSVFIAHIYPDAAQKRHFIEEYDTWPGQMTFVSAELTLKADVSMFPSWNSGQNIYSFREDGTLESETRTLSNKTSGFTRTIRFAPDGKTESCHVGWRSADYGGYELNVTLDAAGTPLSMDYRADGEAFTARSLPLSAADGDFDVLMNNSFDPWDAASTILDEYPVAAASVLHMATMTDLFPDSSRIRDNARIWILSFGDYSDYEEYVIVTEEPLFLLQDKKIVPNTSVKDINGNPVDFASMPSAETPEFDVPVFKQ